MTVYSYFNTSSFSSLALSLEQLSLKYFSYDSAQREKIQKELGSLVESDFSEKYPQKASPEKPSPEDWSKFSTSLGKLTRLSLKSNITNLLSNLVLQRIFCIEKAMQQKFNPPDFPSRAYPLLVVRKDPSSSTMQQEVMITLKTLKQYPSLRSFQTDSSSSFLDFSSLAENSFYAISLALKNDEDYKRFITKKNDTEVFNFAYQNGITLLTQYLESKWLAQIAIEGDSDAKQKLIDRIHENIIDKVIKKGPNDMLYEGFKTKEYLHSKREDEDGITKRNIGGRVKFSVKYGNEKLGNQCMEFVLSELEKNPPALLPPLSAGPNAWNVANTKENATAHVLIFENMQYLLCIANSDLSKKEGWDFTSRIEQYFTRYSDAFIGQTRTIMTSIRDALKKSSTSKSS